MKKCRITFPQFIAVAVSSWLLASGLTTAADTKQDAATTLRKAISYYTEKVATHGGYVYYYSPDLTQRWGEGKATPDQIWVQEPGTPAVGMALLQAYAVTRDPAHLKAAQLAAEALLYGQLQSGGWTNSIDFDPSGSLAQLYRNGKGRKGGRNFSTLDDGITQATLRFLLHLEKASPAPTQAPSLKEGIDTALDALLAAQFPNGGFPQVWGGPVEARPIVKATLPDYDWKTENRIKNYWDHYTLNDGVCGQVAATLEDALTLRNDPRCKAALIKLGEFLLLAQLPEPQPGWAQQYDDKMRPIWARKFEPPAIAGRETEDAMLTLIRIARLTRDARFLTPIAPARAYLQRSLLPDGKLSRYYELKTNRPLYMTDDYQLTHDDSNLPKHYGWQNDARLKDIDTAYAALRPGGTVPIPPPTETDIRRIIDTLDPDGKWISEYDGTMIVGQPKFKPGQSYLSSALFAENITLLSRYLSTK